MVLTIPRLERVADLMVVAFALALPWSTSAASILIVLWALALIPTLDMAVLRRELMTPAGGLPVALFVLGVVGMAWSDASWHERLHSAQAYIRLLAVPLLLVQFQRSSRSNHVLAGFLISCSVLLAVSYAMALWPGLFPGKSFGVPVKSYIQQSVEFTVCAFALIYLAGECWGEKDIRRGLAFAVVALAFLADIFFVATSRTTLVVLPIILMVWALRQFGVKGAVVAVICGAVTAAVIWTASPYLRSRVTGAFVEVQRYETHNASTSAGERLEFWKKSLRFIAEAPVFGHGTGSIRSLFQGAASGSGVSAEVSTNPHNLTLSIAVQLGAFGIALLWAMWLAHLILFRHPGVVGWFGLLVVLQHMTGSMFNTYLFDFTEGWLYIFGVGVLGGTVRRSGRDQARIAQES